MLLSLRLRAQFCFYRNALLLEGTWVLGHMGKETVEWGCSWRSAAYLQDSEGGISLQTNSSQLWSLLQHPSLLTQDHICQTGSVSNINSCIWCWIPELEGSWGAVMWSPETEMPHWREQDGARGMAHVWSMRLDKSGTTHSNIAFDWISF